MLNGRSQAKALPPKDRDRWPRLWPMVTSGRAAAVAATLSKVGTCEPYWCENRVGKGITELY